MTKAAEFWLHVWLTTCVVVLPLNVGVKAGFAKANGFGLKEYLRVEAVIDGQAIS